jgi:hypothetical protein
VKEEFVEKEKRKEKEFRTLGKKNGIQFQTEISDYVCQNSEETQEKNGKEGKSRWEIKIFEETIDEKEEPRKERRIEGKNDGKGK